MEKEVEESEEDQKQGKYQIFILFVLANIIFTFHRSTASGVGESGTSISSDSGGVSEPDYGMNLGDADGYCMGILSLITVYLLMYDVTILANALWSYLTQDKRPSEFIV